MQNLNSDGRIWWDGWSGVQIGGTWLQTYVLCPSDSSVPNSELEGSGVSEYIGRLDRKVVKKTIILIYIIEKNTDAPVDL